MDSTYVDINHAIKIAEKNFRNKVNIAILNAAENGFTSANVDITNVSEDLVKKVQSELKRVGYSAYSTFTNNSLNIYFERKVKVIHL